MSYAMILAIAIVAKFDIFSYKGQVVKYSIFNTEIWFKKWTHLIKMEKVIVKWHILLFKSYIKKSCGGQLLFKHWLVVVKTKIQ
jgi:hypothetical protein